MFLYKRTLPKDLSYYIPKKINNICTYLKYISEFIEQRLVAEGDAYVGHVGAGYVVTGHTLLHVVGA